ncbi:MAG: hypothetical protein R2873_26750 [Caldilineaceae bacterium]
MKRLTKLEPSSSGFILLLGVDRVHPQLAHHNIFFSHDYEDEFNDIFARGLPPREPTIYVAITAKTDAAHAPTGCENWFVLVNTPAENGRFNWQTQAEGYRDLVLACLAHDFDLDVRDHLRYTKTVTPPQLEILSGARNGALYGQSSNDRMAAFRRPHNRASAVKGLYFAGGTTHPGGGVPMVTLSGKVAADLVLEDMN